jgi:carboxypeptidase family protein/TonB-dependent receptor-like protein
MKMRFLREAALLIMIFGIARIGAAQALYGSITGNITDSSGGLIAGANVSAMQLENNEVRTAVTNGNGEYTLATVNTGTYRITVSKAGFSSAETKEIKVSLNTVVRVDAVLQVSVVAQTVTVSAETAALQTDNADVHQNISTQQLQELPQATRTYEALIGLSPGVSPPDPGFAGAGGTNNPARSMLISSNGTSASGTNVRIDGVSATNAWVQYYSTAVPSTEAIETVNVVTASSGADQGMVNGAAINVQIKSGTNNLHGSVYEYHYDNIMKARPFFLPVGTPLPRLIDNDTGGTIGGPILRNRLFFFGSYEGDFLHQGNSNIVTVPTVAMLSGDLSASPSPIYDPTTGNADGTGRTPFTNNIIPTSRFSPVTQKILPLIPAPNLPGAANNYYVNTPTYYALQKIDTKFDFKVSDAFQLFTRVSDYPYNNTQATVFGPILSGGNNAIQNGNIYAVSIGANYVVTPHLVASALFGLTHSSQNLFPPGTNVRYGSDVLGIPGVNQGDLPAAGGFPDFNFNGYTGYGYAYPSQLYHDPVFQYTGNVTWNKGNHNIRFGIDVSQQHMNHVQPYPDSFSFTGGVTALNGGSAPNQYNSFADFLLGLPNSDTNSLQTVHYLTLRTWQFSPYATDQWQVNKQLTFSIGTGWEYYPVPTREGSGIEFFDLTKNQFEICGKGPIPTNCGIHVQKTLFSPRIGVAYRPVSNTVIRAGYSLNPEEINMSRDQLANYPYELLGNYAAANSYSAVTTLSQGIPTLSPVNTSSGVIPLPPGVTFITSPKNFIRGYTQSYNLTGEQDLGHGWLAQLGYVGTHTVHQHTRYNANYGLPGLGAASQPFYNGTQGTGITGAETFIEPYEDMHYNSLQSSLRHAFAHGFEFAAAYTWSRWIGTCCDPNGDSAPEIPIPQYSYLNRALMPGDRTHNLRLSGIAQLPFGPNKPFLTHGVAGVIAGGWQFNAVASFYSGAPFSVSADGTSLDAPGSTQRADQVKQHVQILHGVGSSPYFDPTAFAPVTQARFGTAGFDSLRGPGFGNLDSGLFRNFNFAERFTLQTRIEAYNLTNTPHFSNPNANVSQAGYDTITSTTPGSRTIDERYVRLGVKLTF